MKILTINRARRVIVNIFIQELDMKIDEQKLHAALMLAAESE